MSASKIIAEYAKSGRSACKKCSGKIAKDAPRLGLVSRDPRGYDSTKWHHLKCFPAGAGSIGSLEKIEGFSKWKDDDQAALKKLVDEHEKSLEKKVDEDKENEVEGQTSKKKKVPTANLR